MGEAKARRRLLPKRSSFAGGAAALGFLLFALTVRALREAAGGAAVGFLRGALAALAFCLVFYFVITFFGLGFVTVRGDLMVFILIGAGFFFLMQYTVMATIKAMRAGWRMAPHPHLSPILFVYAESLAVLYNWTLAIVAIFVGNAFVVGRMEFETPLLIFPLFALAWLTGIGIGLVFGFLLGWFSWAAMLKRVFFKIMFFTSGKFTNANFIPPDMLPFFQWNPLFHLIDQMRDAAFVNYTAQKTNLIYPTLCCLALLGIGHLLYDYSIRRRNVMSD